MTVYRESVDSHVFSLRRREMMPLKRFAAGGEFLSDGSGVVKEQGTRKRFPARWYCYLVAFILFLFIKGFNRLGKKI